MKALILLLSLSMIPCTQAAQLIGTRGVSILAVDSTKIKHNFFSDKGITLTDGMHQVVVRFTASHKVNSNDDLIESKPHIFNIDVKGDTEITLKDLNVAYKAKAAVKDGLQWLVINDLGEKKIKNADTLQGTGFLPYANVEKLINIYNNKNSVNLVAKATTLSTANAIQSNLNLMSKDKSALLIDIYNQASQKERKIFRMWLLEQEMK
ncbi:hypothetical protein PCNPT3_05095 [Psychromonas sp. CNPT3]|uniref:DUF2057 domain-containing protein n=1 Tax=Psychromonas sp. CNPT3 TaxID=314282 RepID=UPI00006E48C0|nr:DUF2057 domain-containing protein [Psychromonas sp. CNPT3]AGH80961.1 hypothetical protein PCNPT3_05095 [Psychromonas sp. CNPT3]